MSAPRRRGLPALDPIPNEATVPGSAGEQMVIHKGGHSGIATLSFLATVGVSGALIALIALVPLEKTTVGLLVLALTITLMLSGVHVAVSMALPSLLGIWKVAGLSTMAFAMKDVPIGTAASWSLTVVPLFILMGLVLVQTGITAIIFDAAKQWIGGVPGGLAVATIAAGAGMSATSGSTLGVTYATTRMGVPEMLKAGYSTHFATGTVAMAGVLKMLIPPSITVVIYAGIAETPVGPQLLAGLVPGLLLAVLFVLLIVVRATRNRSLAPAVDTSSFTWGSRFIALGRAWPAALLFTIIVGGIYSGTATATESAAVAALAAIVIGAWMTRRNGMRAFIRILGKATASTVAAVCSIMLLLISVHLLTLFVALTGLMQEVSRVVSDLGLTATQFLLILVVMYLIMGMLMDELAMMLLTVPILLPILVQLDIDLIWFGVFLVLLCEVGMVMPPVGFLSFVVHGIVQHPEVNLGHKISLLDVFRGVLPYVAVALGLSVGLIFAPDLALWLPNLGAD